MRWKMKLQQRSKKTQQNYENQIKQFIEKFSKAKYLIQDDIDDYFNMVQREEESKLASQRERGHGEDEEDCAQSFSLMTASSYSSSSRTTRPRPPGKC